VSAPVAAAVLAATVLVSVGGALAAGFVWDDKPLIVDNPSIRRADGVPHLLLSSFWDTGDKHDRFRAFFRPLVSLSFAIDHALWGLRPFGFHLTNLLLHFGCTWLVYRIAVAEGLGALAALAGAALFAAHPVHVESVAWICGRTDVLCTLFALGSFLLYRRARTSGRRVAFRAGSVSLFLAALFAKEMAATLPLLIGLDAFLTHPGGSRRVSFGERLLTSVITVAPYAAALALYVAARAAVLPAAIPLLDLPAEAWAATATWVVARYLILLLLPIGLDAHYPDVPFESAMRAPVLLAAWILVIVVAAGVALARRGSRAAYWLAFLLVALAPVMLFGRFGDVILADRFLYLPSVGAALLAAFALGALADRPRGRRIAGVVTLCLVGVLAATAAARTRVWRDDMALFSDMLRTSPHSALVHNNIGMALYQQQQIDPAVEHFRQALTIEPSYAMAHNNLAAALERRGERALAARPYERALDLAPGMVMAEQNYGHLQVELGRTEEGLSRLRALAASHPDSAEVQFAAGHAAWRTGHVRLALRYLDRAIEADPSHARAHYVTGHILAADGRTTQAAVAMRRYLELGPAEGPLADEARRTIARAEPTRSQARR
jgi:tetratricopeptide (TPR) repeat protein